MIRKMHNMELHNLYSSPCATRAIKARKENEMGYVVRMGEMRISYEILVGKPDRKIPRRR
jgi:hypothetical protein